MENLQEENVKKELNYGLEWFQFPGFQGISDLDCQGPVVTWALSQKKLRGGPFWGRLWRVLQTVTEKRELLPSLATFCLWQTSEFVMLFVCLPFYFAIIQNFRKVAWIIQITLVFLYLDYLPHLFHLFSLSTHLCTRAHTHIHLWIYMWFFLNHMWVGYWLKLPSPLVLPNNKNLIAVRYM